MTQRVFAKGAGCSQCAVCKQTNRNLGERKMWVKKGPKATMITAHLRALLATVMQESGQNSQCLDVDEI